MENSAYLALPLFAGLAAGDIPAALAALDALCRPFAKGETLLEAGQRAVAPQVEMLDKHPARQHHAHRRTALPGLQQGLPLGKGAADDAKPFEIGRAHV